MRLLRRDDKGELSLTKNFTSKIPSYAILSHTWSQTEEDEISYDDFVAGEYKTKPAFAKLDFCSQQAKKDDLEYFWIDTCCIKRSDSTELSEAINSMFRWYRDAIKCYVYLSDVPNLKRHHNEATRRNDEDALKRSKWFGRGWTLQELLAPKDVEFYSRDGKALGTKRALAHLIQGITKIPSSALLQEKEMSSFRVQERMSWVQSRRTTRPEDKCYCMLGILEVAIPIIYGPEAKDISLQLKSALANRYRDHDLAGLEHHLDERNADWSKNGAFTTQSEIFTLQNRRKVLLDSLSFEQMDTRRSTIKKEYTSTCSWIRNHSVYTDWNDPKKLQQHHGFLWIRGKPGSGKSTLMKFANVQAAKEKVQDEIVISFFFNARGDDLEKSTMGLYRALLFQLFQKAPDLIATLNEYLTEHIKEGIKPDWTVDQLCEMILETLPGFGNRKLRCFIDALDECGEQEIQNMIYFFEDLGQSALRLSIQLYVCFASRHYPTVDSLYGLELILEDEEEHGEDLKKYIENYLRAGKGDSLDDLKTRVREKAKGVFLWAVLVVDILNEELRRGYIPAVEKRLRELPPGLSELFRDIVRRDSERMPEFRLCLYWILFARRPLLQAEYYFAMVAGVDPELCTTLDPRSIDEESMTKYVLSSSKGLAELTRSEKPMVQFIHESVRDFLAKDGGLIELWPEYGADMETHESNAHEQLKLSCQIYITADLSSLFSTDTTPPEADSVEAKNLRDKATIKFPFLVYATKNLFYHADMAAKHVSQADFLKNLELQTWVNVHSVVETYYRRRYTRHVNLPYLFADLALSRLLQAINGYEMAFDYVDEQCGYPILAALANSKVEIVAALLPHSDRPLLLRALSEFRNSWFRWFRSVTKEKTPLDLVVSNRLEALVDLFLREFNCRSQRIDWGKLLCNASRTGSIKMVRLLLDSGGNINAQGGDGENALQAASLCGSFEMVKLLLENGATINAQGGHCGNALQAASLSGSLKIVKLLLKKRATINAKGGHYGNALQAASFTGSPKTVKLLLENEATINAQGGHYGNALQAASFSDSLETVKLLLANGATINAQGGHYGNALQAASFKGSPEMVKLLLANGATINAQGGHYGNALQAASFKGSHEVVKLLLENGADVHDHGGYCGSALVAAIRRCALDTIKLLLDNGADIHALNERALMTAIRCDSLRKVELLLKGGANVHREALDLANLYSQRDIVNLLQRRANILPARSLFDFDIMPLTGDCWTWMRSSPDDRVQVQAVRRTSIDGARECG